MRKLLKSCISRLSNPWILIHLVFATLLVVAWEAVFGRKLTVDMATGMLYVLFLIASFFVVRFYFSTYRPVDISAVEKARIPASIVLYLILPVSYIYFVLIPDLPVGQEFFTLSAMTIAFGALVSPLDAAESDGQAMPGRRVLILGTGEPALAVSRAHEEARTGVRIVGYYPSPAETVIQVPAASVLPRSKPLSQTIRELGIDEVVVSMADRRGGAMPLRELLDCRLNGVLVRDLASHFEHRFGQIRLDALRAGWLVFGAGFRQGVWRTSVKRAFDVAVASILLLLALPVMLATALAIAAESGGPILYWQERVGRHGRTFKVVKFRSMVTDAEKDGKPRWASSNDARVTRVGRLIRKLRIDELPQLFNVLKGDMSMVGPRPERPFFVDKLSREIPFYAIRHSVKPGLTGWAQVRYHYGASVEDAAEKLQYDLYYVKNHSLLLDLLVLFETVEVVLTAKGAQ